MLYVGSFLAIRISPCRASRLVVLKAEGDTLIPSPFRHDGSDAVVFADALIGTKVIPFPPARWAADGESIIWDSKAIFVSQPSTTSDALSSF